MRTPLNASAPIGSPDYQALCAAEDIAQALDEARVEMGIPRNQLGLRAGSSASYAYRILQNPVNISLATLYRFANAAGLKVSIRLQRVRA